ncbi:hypothetical protein VitviT2T_008942 [Vitis vinifera]|uniref:Uncharacterized protein n=1 Tax=Vitis vinifera TaxID=29760 RepID=A0ABY9C3Z5_VITVI|nr:hypothetical protein VitviT2T_008942 [Vitis vinifera]
MTFSRSPRSRAAEIFNVGLGYHHRMLRTCWFFSSHVLYGWKYSSIEIKRLFHSKAFARPVFTSIVQLLYLIRILDASPKVI